MKFMYLKSAQKCNSFDVHINIKILYFRVSVTIEPGHSLLQCATMNCLIYHQQPLCVLNFSNTFVIGFPVDGNIHMH